MKYISREETLKAFRLTAKNPNKDYQRGMQDTIDCLVPEVIADIPSADVQPVNQWISVKDRQPQENGFYLTYYSKQIHVSQWFISANWYNEHGGNVTNNVKYWKPLPELPKDGDTND
jgi:hypothetical protein